MGARRIERLTFSVWLANDVSCFIKIILQMIATNVEIQNSRKAILNRMNRAMEVPKSPNRNDGESGTSMKLQGVHVEDIDSDALEEATAVASVHSDRENLRRLYMQRRG